MVHLTKGIVTGGALTFIFWRSSTDESLLEDSGAFTRFTRAMIGLVSYQELVSPHERFAGIQFNIEPHQQPDWNANRGIWVQRKIDFVEYVHDTYGDRFTIDWCIPAWWHNRTHDHSVTHRGVPNVSLYRAIMDEGNRTLVMAFRNTAERMISFGHDVIAYAQSIGQEVVVIATVRATDPYDHVFFANLGAEEMLNQLGRLDNLILTEFGDVKVGTAVHHILDWHNWPV